MDYLSGGLSMVRIAYIAIVHYLCLQTITCYERSTSENGFLLLNNTFKSTREE